MNQETKNRNDWKKKIVPKLENVLERLIATEEGVAFGLDRIQLIEIELVNAGITHSDHFYVDYGGRGKRGGYRY